MYFVVDSDVASARFLRGDEKVKAVERLRANQTGTGSNEFKWNQALEVAYDAKTWVWLVMAILFNIGSVVTNIFGPTLIHGLVSLMSDACGHTD